MAEDIETLRGEVMGPFGTRSHGSCFAHLCPPPPPTNPPVHAELSGTHHQILALEDTNPGTMTLPRFLLLSLHFCPSSSALRIQLEGEGADSGEEQRAEGGSVCCSILDPAGVGGGRRWALACLGEGTPSSAQPLQLLAQERGSGMFS